MLGWSTRKVIVVLLSVAIIMIGRAAYAADYEYDALNRVTSTQQEQGITTYTYDAGGNLLSVTSTHTPATQKSNLIQGWSAYITPGIKALYQTATVDVYGSSVAQDVYNSATSPGTSTMYGRSGGTVMSNGYGNSGRTVTSNVYGSLNSTVTSNVYNSSGGTVTSDVYAPPAQSMVAQWMTLDARRAGGASIYRDIPVQSHASYTYNGWVTSDQLQDAVVQVVINYYDRQHHLLRYDHVLNLQQATTWIPYTATLTTPTSAAQARVHLQVVLLQPNARAHVGFADRTFKKAGATS